VETEANKDGDEDQHDSDLHYEQPPISRIPRTTCSFPEHGSHFSLATMELVVVRVQLVGAIVPRCLVHLVSAAAWASHVVVLGGGVVEVGMLATKLGVVWVPLVGAIVQCLLVHWAPKKIRIHA